MAFPSGWSNLMGSVSSGGRWGFVGTLSFLILATLCRIAQAATIWDACCWCYSQAMKTIESCLQDPKSVFSSAPGSAVSCIELLFGPCLGIRIGGHQKFLTKIIPVSKRPSNSSVNKHKTNIQINSIISLS